jgi:type II secretory pathway component PulF
MPAFKVVAYAPPPQRPDTTPQTVGSLALAPEPSFNTPLRQEFIRRGPDEDYIEQQLLGEGFKIVSITRTDRIARWKTKYRAEKITLYRHLARYLKKSTRENLGPIFLPMFKPTSPFRQQAAPFLKALENGTVHDAMSSKPELFADWECNIVEIGTTAGEPEMLQMLSDALRTENKVGRWGKQLAIYPTILGFFIIAAFIAYYGVMFPKLLANTQLQPGETYPLYMQIILLPYELYSNLASGILTSAAALAIAGGIAAAYTLIPAFQYFVEWVVLTKTGPYGQLLINSLQIRLWHILRIILDKGQQDRAYAILRGAAVGRVASSALERVHDAQQSGGKSWAHALFAGTPLFDTPTVARIVSAETIDATRGMIAELADIKQEKEEDSEILFESYKTRLNSTMIIIFAGVIGLMYLGLYLPVQFFLTHAHGA